MPTDGQKSAAAKFLETRCQWHIYSLDPDVNECRARSYRNSDLCKKHQDAKKKMDAKIDKASKAKADEPLEKVTDGPNYKAAQDLRNWIAAAGSDALDRFGVQLAQLDTLSIEMDSGRTTGIISVHRQLTKDILERVDRVYGGENLDIVTRLDNLINQHAAERVASGW